MDVAGGMRSMSDQSRVAEADHAAAMQDPTNMPVWTGKDTSLASEDEHMASRAALTAVVCYCA